MTGRAVLRRIHFPVVRKLFSLRLLHRWILMLPAQVCDFIEGTKIRTGISVTLETEGHAEGFFVVNFLHLIDLAVTMNTADTPVYMDGVVEINVIGKLVDLHPGDLSAALGCIADECQPGILLEHLVVTVHARRGGGEIGIPTLLHL